MAGRNSTADRGKRSIRNPYLFTQFIMFSIIVRIVRGLYGFVELCCFHSDIKKAILFILLRCVLSTSYLLYYLGCRPRMLCLATLSKVFQLYMESGMSMDFLSMFASNV